MGIEPERAVLQGQRNALMPVMSGPPECDGDLQGLAEVVPTAEGFFTRVERS